MKSSSISSFFYSPTFLRSAPKKTFEWQNIIGSDGAPVIEL